MRFLGFILFSILIVSGCKQPSEQATANILAATSSSSWITFSEFRNSDLDANKIYILKFGTASCIPCIVLKTDLPPLAKEVSPTKFVLVAVDLDKDESAEKVLQFLIGRDEKMKADYLAKKGDFQYGITVPWVIAVDSAFNPKAFLHGYNSSEKDKEKLRYKNALSKSIQ